MARQSTANINLTYEIDKNNNFSYDDDVKNNLIAIDQAIGEDRTRLDNLDNPQSAPITIESNIHSMSNSSKGQISVDVNGRTYMNMVENGNFAIDNNSDGLADNWTAIGSSNFSIVNGIQKFTPSTQYGRIEQSFKREVNHNYYISALVKTTDPEIKLAFAGASHSGSGNYERLHGIYNSVDSATATLQLYKTGTGATSEVECSQVTIIDLTALGDTETDVDVLAQKYPFITYTKSTLSTRIKSIGKNLFNPNLVFTSTISDNGNTNGIYARAGDDNVFEEVSTNSFRVGSTADSYRGATINYFNLKPNTYYTVSGNLDSFETTGDFQLWDAKSSTNRGNITSTGTFNTTSLMSDPLGNIELRIETANTTAVAIISNIQLEEGSTATTFEEYKESIMYVNLPDGVDGLHSLPNGVKDEVSDGVLYKRTSKKTIDGTKTWIELTHQTNHYAFANTDLAGDGKVTSDQNSSLIFANGLDLSYEWNQTDTEHHYVDGLNRLVIYIEKSKIDSQSGSTVLEKWSNYLTSNNATLIYQLAQEDIIENGENGFSITGSLASYDGETTIIAEPYLKKSYTIYSGTITLDYPIESIDNLAVLQGGIFVDATGTLSSDGKTITVSGAGTYQVEGVIKSEEHAGQQLVVTYPLNTAASIQSIGDLANDNAALISDHEWKILYIADDFIALEQSLSQQGATSARPTSPNAGDMYFDTDLGKPIWYNGTAWIDATATTV